MKEERWDVSERLKVTCPYCGYKMQISYKKEAACNGVYVRCKGRNCKKIFEIQIQDGKQCR